MPNFRDIIIYTLINLSEQLATQVALGSSLFLLFLVIIAMIVKVILLTLLI